MAGCGIRRWLPVLSTLIAQREVRLLAPMIVLKLIARAVLAFALVATPLFADTPAPPEPRLVDLRVLALDNNGQAVTYLTAADFQVTDGGKPQKVALLRYNNTAARHTPNLGLNEVSNRGSGEIPHATVILFDLMNEGFDTRGSAMTQIVRTLSNLESSDYVYLYILTVDGQLFSVHGLPGTGGLPSSGEGPWTQQIKPLMDTAMRAVTRLRSPGIDVAARVQLTFQAMEILAAQMARVPGRKNLVWITDGVPLELGPMRSDTGDFVDFTPQLRMVSEQLDQAGVAVYPARQVIFGGPDEIGSTSGFGQTGGAGQGMESEQTLDNFAATTGGRLDHGKDVSATVNQAIKDMQSSYLLAYYPPAQYWDGKFHKLRVICKRKGVRIQTKTGYYAWADLPGARAQQAFNMVSAMMFDAAEIGLRAEMSRDTGNAIMAHVDLHIDAHDVALVPDGNDYMGELQISMVHYLTAGGAKRSSIIPLTLRYNAAERDKALQDGVDFTQDIAVDANETLVRIIVFDRGSNAVGSISIPIYARMQNGTP